MLVVLLIAGFALIFWLGWVFTSETPDEKAYRIQQEKEKAEKRLSNNLRELRIHRDMPLLKFKSPEEAEQFFALVAKDGSIRSLPPVYREQAERYLSTKPLTIAQARAELKAECEKIYQDKDWKTNSYITPKSCIKEWEYLEEMSKRDTQQYRRAIKARFDKPWFRMPTDEDFIYCVLDIVIQDEFPDTAQLYKYISNLTDDGIEKLMGIIGNKLERLNG